MEGLEGSLAVGALPSGSSGARYDPGDIQQTRIQPDIGGSRPSGSRLPADSRGSGAALVLVTTDPPLKAAPKELLPLGVSLLVQYDLPLQKVRCWCRYGSVLARWRTGHLIGPYSG